jgi:hypothetical protein
MRQCHLDQGLAGRARDQDVGGDRKRDRPEIAGAGDVGDRLARGAAGEEGGEGRRGGIVEMGEEQGVAGNAERMGHEEFGVEAGGGAVGSWVMAWERAWRMVGAPSPLGGRGGVGGCGATRLVLRHAPPPTLPSPRRGEG